MKNYFEKEIKVAVAIAKNEMAAGASKYEAAKLASEEADCCHNLKMAALFVGQCPDIEAALESSNPELYEGFGAGGSALLNIAMEVLEHHVIAEI